MKIALPQPGFSFPSMPPTTRKPIGPRRAEFATLIVAICFCLAGLAFIYVLSTARNESHKAIEDRFLLAWRNPENLGQLKGPIWLEGAARDVTALGSSFVLTTITIGATAYFLLHGRRRIAALMAISAIGGQILSSVLKEMVSRPRPSVVPHLTGVADASFPSGHSLVSSVVYLTLGALLAETSGRHRDHMFFLIVALVLVVLVGLSRMALGVHYPSDVMGGWLAGSIWALTCWMLYRMWHHQSAFPRQSE